MFCSLDATLISTVVAVTTTICTLLSLQVHAVSPLLKWATTHEKDLVIG